MISEKTVELNLTTELLNWLHYTTGRVHTAIGPSQRAEGHLGFDVAYFGGGPTVLIQYKRAYVDGSQWTWHLNRTRLQDQHERLQRLERAGIPVFYAFPRFHTINEVLSNRRHLLMKTSWYPPSMIQPAGGPRGHHDVHYDTRTSRWWVTSDPVELDSPPSFEVLRDVLSSRKTKNDPEHLERLLNELLVPNDEVTNTEEITDGNNPSSGLVGMALIMPAEPDK